MLGFQCSCTDFSYGLYDTWDCYHFELNLSLYFLKRGSLLLFWRNNFLLWAFCVSNVLMFSKCVCVCWAGGGMGVRGRKNIWKWPWPYSGLSLEKGGLCRLGINNHVLLWLFLPCLLFRLVANIYVHLCLNWSKSVYGDSRCHSNEK